MTLYMVDKSSRLVDSLGRSNNSNSCSYPESHCFVQSLHPNFWIFSSNIMSLTVYGLHTGEVHSRCGLTNDMYNLNKT